MVPPTRLPPSWFNDMTAELRDLVTGVDLSKRSIRRLPLSVEAQRRLALRQLEIARNKPRLRHLCQQLWMLLRGGSHA